MFKPSKENLEELMRANDYCFQFIGDYGDSDEWLDENNPLTKAIWNATLYLCQAVKIVGERVEE